MIVRNNYNECITNLACSIQKYFDIDYKHNTLEYIDKILKDTNPKNVVIILCDGMGSRILDRVLNKNDFLIKNRLKEITTVFPATTVAATTAITTGLNPVESGMLGWNMYYKDLDKVVTTYFNCEKSDPNEIVQEDIVNYRKIHMKEKTISSYINETGKYKGYSLYPFGPNAYETTNDMYERIEALCNEDGKKYIYAYNTEPDSTMHELGSNSKEAYNLIKKINNDIENLSTKLKDTALIVIADHGHINVENIHLENYPDIVDCLDKNTSLEPRAVNFFIKAGKKEIFENLFNKYFGNDFNLYQKEDIINSCLFGTGEENEIFRDALGDYLAIAKTNKAILYNGGEELKSQHAGYTDDEIYVPLIVYKA